MAKETKCSCNLGYMLGAIILFTVGLYALIGGFAAQLNGTIIMTTVLGWYFVGILLMSLGKMLKWKSYETCHVHVKK
ncbi:MAG: hypothetical protein HY832_01960 [Candidatus Aenigmarchaeota archaeon]|nr:hypothetical protein [Candidatus Aenigmarchaeota archaeon]